MKLIITVLLLINTSQLLSNDSVRSKSNIEGFIVVELRKNIRHYRNYFEPYLVIIENFTIKRDTSCLITSIWSGHGTSFEDLKGCNQSIPYYDTTLSANIPNLNVFDTLIRSIDCFSEKLQRLKTKYPDTKNSKHCFFYFSGNAMLREIRIRRYSDYELEDLTSEISKPDYKENASYKGSSIKYYFLYDFTTFLRLK